jgi:AcrR family transcriptional regulator
MKKSETRRQAILDAAAEVFAESGFDRASMADICTRVGYSKTTLYSYFGSKEALFLDLVTEATQAGLDATHASLAEQQAGVAATLEHFARAYLAHSFSPRIAVLRRLLVAQAGRPGFESRRYDLGTVRSAAALARFLRSAMDAGHLREADHGRAALHLKALLEAEWSERYLFETPPALSPEQVERTATIGVATFMAAYAPVGTLARA